MFKNVEKAIMILAKVELLMGIFVGVLTFFSGVVSCVLILDANAEISLVIPPAGMLYGLLIIAWSLASAILLEGFAKVVGASVLHKKIQTDEIKKKAEQKTQSVAQEESTNVATKNDDAKIKMLTDYKKLLDGGALTEEEFNTKKQSILNS